MMHSRLVAAARTLLALKDVSEGVAEDMKQHRLSSPDILKARIGLARRIKTAHDLNLWLLRYILRQDPNTAMVFRAKLTEANIVLSRAERMR